MEFLAVFVIHLVLASPDLFIMGYSGVAAMKPATNAFIVYLRPAELRQAFVCLCFKTN